jgi:hypothetical protein
MKLPGTTCTRKSKKILDDVYAILEKDNTVKKAWRIEQTKMKFEEISVNDLACQQD